MSPPFSNILSSFCIRNPCRAPEAVASLLVGSDKGSSRWQRQVTLQSVGKGRRRASSRTAGAGARQWIARGRRLATRDGGSFPCFAGALDFFPVLGAHRSIRSGPSASAGPGRTAGIGPVRFQRVARQGVGLDGGPDHRTGSAVRNLLGPGHRGGSAVRNLLGPEHRTGSAVRDPVRSGPALVWTLPHY